MKDEEKLLKAKAKSLASHFKKMAGHHEAMADSHEKCMKAHEAHAEHFAKCMGKSEDPMHETHKASHAFHKSMASHHEKMHKRHSASAEHLHSMSAASSSEDAKKVLELSGIPEEEITSFMKVEPTATPAPAATPVAAPAVAAPAPVTTAAQAIGDLNETITKALDAKLTEGVNAALERVLNSEEFNKKMDNTIATKLLEKLGSTATVPTDVRTMPPVAIPRTEGNGNGYGKTSVPDLAGIDAELVDFVKFE
jgi:hypothetical protein